MLRVNYDSIAHLFDEPGRTHDVDRHLLAFLDGRDAGDGTTAILDVGCGTGTQLAANAAAISEIRSFGLDRFAGMLRIARKRCPTAVWIQGDGAELPFASNRFDYACNQFSYQHVRNTKKMLGELVRVLKPGGRFVMTNIDPWSMTGWSVYRYFPEALALDYQDFLPADRFASTMREAGFDIVLVERTPYEQGETLGEFLEYASQRHRASQLMAISDAAYADGLRRLREDASTERDRDRPLESELVVLTVIGDKPVKAIDSG